MVDGSIAGSRRVTDLALLEDGPADGPPNEPGIEGIDFFFLGFG